MNIWTWIHDFEMEAQASGDRERVRLATLHGEAYSHRQSDPDRMLALLEEGRRLALRLHEPWWVLFYEHWKLETLIYYKDDYREVIDLAVRATLELRKPIFESYPLRFGIWCNLVAAYLCVEPHGYIPAIREALAYLQTQVPAEGGDRYLLQARRHWFAYEIGELEEAHALALEELAMADSDLDRLTARHHEVDTYKALCWIAFRRGDWATLAEYASTGEERARSMPRDYRYELALFVMWQALCARRDGYQEQARRLARQGTAQMARLGQPPGESYYDALATFHEMGENSEEAWQVRQRELETTVGKGQLAYGCLVRLKRVRLLRKLGRPIEAEVEAVHEAMTRLRAPGWYREELDRVLRGESNERDRRV
jgi:hypothetical protein